MEPRVGSCDSKASYRSPYGLSYFRSVTSLLDNSDFGKFCAILGGFLFFIYIHLIYYGFMSLNILFNFIWFCGILDSCNLILDSSISFWQFNPFSVVSLIFLSVFVQFQPVIETGPLSWSLRRNILQTP